LKKPDSGHGPQAACFLLCALVGLHVTSGLGETEFGGGWLTGPLLSMADSGALLFILASVGTFFWPRIAAAVGLASTLLCLPLYSFFIAPGRIRSDIRTRTSVEGPTDSAISLGNVARDRLICQRDCHLHLCSTLRS
jgi:hypothetical protein